MIQISSSLLLVLAIALSCATSKGFAGQNGQSLSEEDSDRRSFHPGLIVYGYISGGNSSMTSWTVELIPLSTGEAKRTTPHPDGSFELDTVAPGQHELRVRDANGRMLRAEMVSLYRNHEMLSVTIPSEGPSPQSPQSATVSVQQLQHKVPRKALNEYRKGKEAMKARQVTLAVQHLKTAVDLDPAFADAHSDLGVAYLRLEDYRLSAEQFQKAIDLDANHQPANNNLCIVLLKMKSYAEAEQAAGRILRRGADSPIAHYVAAVTLLARKGSQSEVLDHLRRAQDAIPRARLLTASILAEAGRRNDAAHELEAYLRSPDGDSKRPDLEAWLAELRQ